MTEAETGWYLRHRDGVEHGPFRLADIMAAARQGNLADDTCLRHETQTLGQWVYAPRVQSIAAVMTKTVPRKSPPRSAVAQGASPARRSASSSFTANVSATAGRGADPATGERSPSPQPSASTTASTTSESRAEPGVAVLPHIRPLREQGYPVPKTFAAACIALVDCRFRSFVTPWIIKILWAVCLAGALLWAGKLAYELFIQGELPATGAAEAVGATGEWQFEPLEGQPFLQSKWFRFPMMIGVMLILLMCLRVVCEAALILVRLAGDLHDWKLQSKD